MEKHMTRRIPYFTIEGTPGGNQEWFSDFWMHLGGCAALAACDMCLCLALNYGLASCITFPIEELSRKNYERFGMIMKPYIRPRMGGVTKLSYFTEGMGAYMERHGFKTEFLTLSGKEPYEKAEAFIRKALELDVPVAYLNLSHTNASLRDLWWHWFSITGYEESERGMKVCYHTYGEELKVDFRTLWESGMLPKGGMVALAKILK